MTKIQIYRSPIWIGHGYRAVKVRYSDGSSSTLYEHREMVEHALGRKLRSDEHVHHIDGNKLNNSLNNLEVMTRTEHLKHHAAERPPEMWSFACPECGVLFLAKARRVRDKQVKQSRPGPFCGKSCAGRFNQKKQEKQDRTGTAKLQIVGPNRKVTYVKAYPHGTRDAYRRNNCRCVECKAAHAAYTREARKRRKIRNNAHVAE